MKIYSEPEKSNMFMPGGRAVMHPRALGLSKKKVVRIFCHKKENQVQQHHTCEQGMHDKDFAEKNQRTK